MITRLKPLIGEIELGYLGRVMRLNGTLYPKNTLDLASFSLGYSRKSHKDYSTLELISRIADSELHHFICQHTILPLRRSITNDFHNYCHGHKNTLGMLNRHGIRKARRGSFFCKECIKEDKNLYGYSFWRRNIQIPGQFWCDTHQIPLSYTLDHNAYYSSPSIFLSSAHTFDKTLVLQFKKNNNILNFIKLSLGLLNRSKPLHKVCVSDVLLRQFCTLKKAEFCQVLYDESSLFGDIIHDSFHPQWLKMSCPFFIYYQRLYHYNFSNLLNYRNSKLSVYAYILAASVLFETAEEALHCLTQTHI